MSLTFDEALKELDDDTRVTDEDNIEYTVGLDFGEVESVIEELRVTYAPTVYMPEQQYTTFKNWRFHTAGWHLSNCLEWARYENIAATDAMQV